MQHSFLFIPTTVRLAATFLLCAALIAGMARPALAQGPAGNTPASADADPITVGYGVQTPAGDGVTALNGEPITYTINLVNLTGAVINNISVFNPLPEDTLDTLICTPVCGQAVTTRTIPDPLGGVIEVTRTLAVSWFVPALSPGAGAGVQLRLVGRVIGRMAGTSFSSSAIASFAGGAVGSNAVQVTVAAIPRNTNGARVESAPTWFSADAGGTLDQDWGDVNRDGALDLALASSIGTSVYRNNAGLLTRIWGVPQLSYGVKWADVDNDGVLELVVVGDSEDKTAQTTGRNRIYKYNAGTGNLGLLSEFTSTRQLVRVAVSDLDRDGDIDIIGSTNAIAVDCAIPIFLNNGAGQFPVTSTLCLPGNKATAAISLGDMNNDDKPDLALGAFPNDVLIQVNGTITTLLQSASTIPITTGLSFLPYDFSWGDFDEDGFLDLAAAFPLDRQARIYRNESSGSSRKFTLHQILPNPTFMTPLSVDWADIDGDGRLDLVSSGSPSVVYVRNVATGQFFQKADLGANTGSRQVWEARAAETSIDQGLNLVFTNRDNASMMFDAIAPRLSPIIQPVFGTDVLPASHVALADLDRNGFIDMLQGASADNVRTRGYLNIDSSFPGFFVFPTLLGPQRIAVADIGSEGVLEVAIGERTQLGLYTPNGTLQRNIVVPANGPFVPAWGDVNDDGLLDLFVSSNGPTFIYMNNAGTLANAPAFQTAEQCQPDSFQSSGRALAVMDVTGDRYMDFVVGCYGAPTRLYRNNRDNTFTLIWTAPASTPTTDVALDDFNGDGKPDLAVANDGQPIQVYENTGSTFASNPIWNSGTTSRVLGIAWGDWNSDGYPELAAATSNAPLDVYANLGSQFGRPQLQRVWRSSASSTFTSVAWGDIDNDGDLDLVSSGIAASATGIFENTINKPYQVNTPGDPVQQVDLPRVPLYVSLNRPGNTSDAFFNSTSEFLTNPNVANVPVNFTVYGPDGSRANALAATVPVHKLVYEYSLDGGSTWRTATPATTTVPITQVTRAGIQGMFLWNARADKAISDNTHFRVRAIAKAPDGPVQRAASAAITPPFRVRSTTCFWAETAGMIYSPTLPTEKQTIAFAGGQVGGSGSITFSWQFGDGVTRIGQLVTHSYTVAGNYTVTLTVVGAACPITRPLSINMPVTVNAGPPVYTLYMPVIANGANVPKSAMKVTAPAIDLSQQVTALSGEMNDGQLRLAWQPPASTGSAGAQPDGYRVYRSTSKDGRVLLAEAPAAQTNYTDAAATCGAAYDVTWVRDGVESPPSAASYYTEPCVVATKKPAAATRVGRFNLAKTTPATTSASAVLNAMPSLAPQAIFTPTIKTCDPMTGTVQNPRPSLISISSQPALNAGGNIVAFWSTGNLDPSGLNADGSIELYVAGPITGTQGLVTMTQVTSSSGSILGGFNLWPSVSADGTKIAFASDRDLVGQNPEANFEVYVAKLGPNRSVSITQISSTPAGVSLVPSMSADGNHVAFASDGNYANSNNDRSLEIFIANLAGTQVVSYAQVTSAPPEILFDLPSISDDGQRAAFVQREFSDVNDVVSQTVVAWMGGSGPSSLISVHTTATDPRPAISGNGRYVAFVHSDLPEGPFELWVADLNSPITGINPVAVANVIRECKPFISNDGARVGCINAPNPSPADQQIAIYNPSGNTKTTGPVVGNNAQPALASAGDTVAYVNNNDQVEWITCRSADLALVLPVSNSVPVLAGKPVTMTVPVSNLGPSTSPTTTLYYTFTTDNGENIFIAGKPASSTVTGAVSVTSSFPANTVLPISVVLSTTEGAKINMDWLVVGAADDTNPTNNATSNSITIQSDVRFNIALAVSSSPTTNVRAGDPITYTVVLTNIGTSRATGVRITDTLPAETSFVTYTAASSTAQPVTCMESPALVLGCLLTDNLPSQGIVTLTVRASVTVTALGPLTNVVFASANESFGIVSKTLTTTVLPQADLQIGAVVSPARPVAGQFAVYTLFYTNTGLVGVPDIAITVTLPQNAVYVLGSSTPWVGPDINNRITAGPTSLGSQSGSFVTYTVYISPEKQIGDPLTTTVLISSAQQAAGIGSFDPDNDNNTDTQTTTVDRMSDFSISLDASPSVIAGQSITYALVFTNAGPSDADHVTVTVSAPALTGTLTFIRNTPLGVGGTDVAVFTATVGGGYFTPTLASTAIITSVNTDNFQPNNTSVFTSGVTASADLSVSISSAAIATAGNALVYTVSYTNAGPSSAQNTFITVTLPFSITDMPPGWTLITSQTVRSPATELLAGSGFSDVITTSVPADAAVGIVAGNAVINSVTFDPDTGNNAAAVSSTVNAEANLSISLAAPATATAGTSLNYTVTYSNAGPSVANGTVVTLTLPFSVTSAPGWTPVNTRTIALPAFTLADGASATSLITVGVPAAATASPPPVTATATMTSTTTDPVAGNNSVSRSVSITRSADVSITVTAPSPVKNSNNFAYTVTLTNIGPSNLTSPTFTVDWSSKIKTLVAVSAGWTPVPAAGTGKVDFATFTSAGALPAGGSTTAIITITTPKKGSSLSATFNTSSATVPDPVASNNSATITTSLSPVYVNAITLTASSSTVITGMAATFTATIGPESASWDITYNWLATNQGVVTPIITESDEITQTFTWTTLGPQVVTVTAINGGLPVTATRIITVTPVNLNNVVISTPVSLAPPGTPFTFTANVFPVSATLPITYAWFATGQSPQTQTGGGLSAQQVFTWNVLGPQLVTVTATNAGNTVTNTFIITVTPVNLANVVISTPVITAPIGSAFTFTATSSPANATQPITYAWSATNQSPQTIPGGGLTSTKVFTWNVLGPQVVTVTATNAGNTVTHTFVVTVAVIPIASAAISTPVSTAPTGAPFTFTANLLPVTATLPVNYTWTATGQSPQVQTGVNALSSTVVFTWPAGGTQVVTVTADNGGSSAVATRIITVTNINLTSVSLTTPALTSQPGMPFTFTANALPVNATLPITYAWFATGQSPQTQTVGGLSAQQIFTWNVMGRQLVTVTATNAGNTVTATLVVTPTPINLTSITLTTPALVQPLGSPFTFNAGVQPPSATTPITYTWTATNQGPQTVIGTTSPISRTYAWSVLGPQWVTITAANLGSTVAASLVVTVTPVNMTSVAINTAVSTAPINTAFAFSANVLPVNANLPITYSWSATGQSPQTQTGGGLSASQWFTWSSPGVQVVTVTATNAGNTVTATMLVTVTAVPLSSVSITTTLDTQLVLSNFAFTANALPLTAGVPITYTWSATGQSTVVLTGQGLSSLQNFNWSTPGPQVVNVTADNGVNAVSSSFAVTVTPVAPASVLVSASPTVNLNVPLGINASVSPFNVTLPLTYTWEATNQIGPIVNASMNNAFDNVSYAWIVTGTQNITVVVSNGFGDVVTGTAQLEVVP